jgi:hypothetical protein
MFRAMGLGRQGASDERRNAVRLRALLSGKVIVGDALYTADCVIVDVSDTGARVRIDPGIPIAPPVSLLFVRDGRLFDVVAAWRRGDEVGVLFRDAHDLKTDTHPNRRRIRELWEALLPRAGDPEESPGATDR